MVHLQQFAAAVVAWDYSIGDSLDRTASRYCANHKWMSGPQGSADWWKFSQSLTWLCTWIKGSSRRKTFHWNKVRPWVLIASIHRILATIPLPGTVSKMGRFSKKIRRPPLVAEVWQESTHSETNGIGNPHKLGTGSRICPNAKTWLRCHSDWCLDSQA